MNFNYLVGYTVAEDRRLGIRAYDRIIAGFETYIYAEDFIKKCMPAENQHRFFIKATWNGQVVYPVK